VFLLLFTDMRPTMGIRASVWTSFLSPSSLTYKFHRVLAPSQVHVGKTNNWIHLGLVDLFHHDCPIHHHVPWDGWLDYYWSWDKVATVVIPGSTESSRKYVVTVCLTYMWITSHIWCLISYPAVYIVCIIPNSISRWLSFTGHCPPYKIILLANILYSFSGFFNLILLYNTRPVLLFRAGYHGRETDGNAIHLATLTPP